MDYQTDFHFVFQRGESPARPLLLLHGTGGNEHDLLDLAAAVAPSRTVISPRGKVLENGMPRFFRRFAEGQFDEADIRSRAADLATFIGGACKHYGIAAPIALGFSNGANIAAALLTLHPQTLGGAILLRAMAPLKAMPQLSVKGLPVLLASGRSDPMIPLPDAERLATALREGGAELTHEILPAGHGLVQADVTMMSRFLAAQE